MQTHQTEIAIIGAGIVGLAHALAFAKRGHQVTVFERNEYALGASIRNFGMVWPIGQPQGKLYQRAMKSREIWLEIVKEADFFANPCGSLLVINEAEEMAVAEEFYHTRKNEGYQVELLNTKDTLAKSKAVNPENLLGGLWSSTEVIVDPREAIFKIPSYLKEKYGVRFEFGKTITQIEYPYFQTSTHQKWQAERIFVCSGADFETLYPEKFAETGITKCKLQMMRSTPMDFDLETSLYGGLTLTHYGAFAHCVSLDALKQKIQQEMPDYVKWGIHVMICQNGNAELVIGDTHEYGLSPSPFDSDALDNLVLNYLNKFTNIPQISIGQRWQGVYPKLFNQTELILQPEQGVWIVNGLGGAGMTLSFGLAEEVVDNG